MVRSRPSLWLSFWVTVLSVWVRLTSSPFLSLLGSLDWRSCVLLLGLDSGTLHRWVIAADNRSSLEPGSPEPQRLHHLDTWRRCQQGAPYVLSLEMCVPPPSSQHKDRPSAALSQVYLCLKGFFVWAFSCTVQGDTFVCVNKMQLVWLRTGLIYLLQRGRSCFEPICFPFISPRLRFHIWWNNDVSAVMFLMGRSVQGMSAITSRLTC